MPSLRHIPLRGSERPPLLGARVAGPVPAGEHLELTLYLRSRNSNVPALLRALDPLLRTRRHLTHKEFAAQFAAHPRDLEKIHRFARENGLAVAYVDLACRTVVLRGSNTDCSAAFGVRRRRFEHPAGSYASLTGPVHIPRVLAGIVQAVLGLDERPIGRRGCLKPQARAARAPASRQAGYAPPEIARLYNFPRDAEGTGQCIALIELGGGYKAGDLSVFFRRLRLPVPPVSSVCVQGARNDPSSSHGSYDGEVTGDMEVGAAIAPGASIAVYFAPSTERGFCDAVTQAIHDHRHQPSIISISWGDAEENWSPRTMWLFNQALADAATLGITVCCATGDYGSSCGLDDKLPHVYFPASSPYALACGGTSLRVSHGRIVQETVWNDPHGCTGGGVSNFFARPSWQAHFPVPTSRSRPGFRGRGLPDVSGDADPMTGYKFLLDGKMQVSGGTSAVAPLWAALVACLNQKLGHRLGFLNSILYPGYRALLRAGAFREITSGSNGAFSARKGWNPCTGLGSPNGEKLAAALASLKAK